MIKTSDRYKDKILNAKTNNGVIMSTNIEKFTGMAKATIFPNKEPLEIESPTMTPIPHMARTIEINATKETFSFKKK